MLGLANKYWRWRSGADLPFTVFKTEDGTVVHKFKGRDNKAYAVVKHSFGRHIFHYHDFVSGSHAWSRHSDYFCDCIVTLETVEKKFGKVILPKEEGISCSHIVS